MVPPPMAGGEQAVAQDNLEKARKLIADLEKKGCQVSEAKGWYDQAKDMFKSGLFRTSIIYSSYALDAGNEMVQRIKDMVLRVTKVKARAVDQLGKDHKHMPRIDEMVEDMKKAINEGRLDDCQELIAQVDEVLRGGTSPYISTTSTARAQVVKTAQPSRGYSSCPSCGNIVESDWSECKYCGQDLKEGEGGGGGPAWTSGGGGPLLVSDEKTARDTEDMERTNEDMERVDEDIHKQEHEMAREAERTVDERTDADMGEQEAIKNEEERTEDDLGKPVQLPPELPPLLPPPLPPTRTADEETSTDMRDQEAIERSMEKVEADLETSEPVQQTAPPPDPDIEERKAHQGRMNAWRDSGYDVTRLEKITGGDLHTLRSEFERYAKDVDRLQALAVRFYKLADPRSKKVEPFLKKPDEVDKLEKVIEKFESKAATPPAEAPKPIESSEAKPAEAAPKPPETPPPEANPAVEKTPEAPKPPPPSDAPKKFFIPPPPKVTFDDFKLPPFPSKSKVEVVKCPSCGEEIEPDFKSCPFCKTPINM